MSTIFDRLGAVLVTWYPHFARNALQFPGASPHLPLMRRVGAASAGLALWQVSAEATGYVGGEGHLRSLIPCARSMARAIVFHDAPTVLHR